MTELFSRAELRALCMRPISGQPPAAVQTARAGSSRTVSFLWSEDQCVPLRPQKHPHRRPPKPVMIETGLGLGKRGFNPKRFL